MERTHRPMAAPGISPNSCQIRSRSSGLSATRVKRCADLSFIALTPYFSAAPASRRTD